MKSWIAGFLVGIAGVGCAAGGAVVTDADPCVGIAWLDRVEADHEVWAWLEDDGPRETSLPARGLWREGAHAVGPGGEPAPTCAERTRLRAAEARARGLARPVPPDLSFD